jgi:hypothetical protein
MGITANSIAGELFKELGEPSNVTQNSIACWIVGNIGSLGVEIGVPVSTSSQTSDIKKDDCGTLTDISNEEKHILKLSYLLSFNRRMMRSALSDALIYPLEVDSDGAKVKLNNRSEISKTYAKEAENLKKEFDAFVYKYRSNKNVPRQVTGDDIVGSIGRESYYERF